MQVASRQGSRVCDSVVDISSVVHLFFFLGDGAKPLVARLVIFADSASVDGGAESAFLRNVDLLMTTLLRFCGDTTLDNSLPESPSSSSPPPSSLKSLSLSSDWCTSSVVVLLSLSLFTPTSSSLLSASSCSLALCCSCSCCFFLFSALIWSRVLMLKSRLLLPDGADGGGCFDLLTKGGGRLALAG